MSSIRLLSADDLRRLHVEGIEFINARDGLRSDTSCPERCLDAVAGAVAQGLSLSEEWSVLSVAAYTLEKVATKHCCTDGNKRLAWLACVEVLKRNGLAVESDAVGDDGEFPINDAALTLILDVLQKKSGLEQVVDWLADHVVDYDVADED